MALSWAKPQNVPRGAIVYTLEVTAHPQAKGGKLGAAEQAFEPVVETGGHVSRSHVRGNLRSGSSSRRFARPSQVQRETNTASTPSRRCSWQMETPGSSA